MATFGWMRRNMGQGGRVAQAMAGSALVAASYLIGVRWARTAVASLGGALTVEAATGVSLGKLAAGAMVREGLHHADGATGHPGPAGS